MKTDIYQKMEKEFGDDLQLALVELEALDARSKGLVGDRMLRAMVYLAEGNVERFREVIERSRTEYVEVLRQAEFAGGEERVYDFGKSFHALHLMGE